MNTKELGQKIRNFRKRAGLSQFDLEIAIGASAGSISRIENGEVNPTKETIVKIIDELDLNSSESLELFEINFDFRNECLKRLKIALDRSTMLQNICQIAVNHLVYELDYFGCFIALVKKDKIYLKASTQNWATELCLKILPKSFPNLSVPLNRLDNNMVRAIVENKIIIGERVEEFIYPAVNKITARMIQQLTKPKACIALPLECDGKILGSLFLAKAHKTDFQDDMEFLKEYTKLISYKIFT